MNLMSAGIGSCSGMLTREGLTGPGRFEVLNGELLSWHEGQGPDSKGILVPCFTNAHSHLEYYTLMGKTVLGDMGEFLTSIVALKSKQTPEEVLESCRLAAKKNFEAGVARIWEHSDRPGSRAAMAEFGLTGQVQREVIDFFTTAFVSTGKAKAEEDFEPGFCWGPHAPYSIHRETLAWFSESDWPLSIHCAESLAEVELLTTGHSSWDSWRLGPEKAALPTTNQTPVELLESLGFLKLGRQLVHCCAVSDSDIEIMARSGVSAAHCPRSNKNLDCPIAPVRRMREAGVQVGIGLDSSASAGEIDYLAEMREAMTSSRWLGEPLSVEDIWQMACFEGADAMGVKAEDGPWMLIEGVDSLEEALLASPTQIRRL